MQHTHSTPHPITPDYELHVPRSVTYPLQVGGTSLALAGALSFLLPKESTSAVILPGISLLAGGVYVGLYLFLTWLTNLNRRLTARDKFLDQIPWKGDEFVLDVGCGNGILTMGTAKRLTTGKIIGIETWTEFAGDSRSEAFLKNARLEGVADRVALENEDARHLPYSNDTFDVIVTSLTIHHMGFDTQKAMQELARVLKPGGRMAISDEPSTIFYCEKLLRQNGFQIEKKMIDMVFGIKPHP